MPSKVSYHKVRTEGDDTFIDVIVQHRDTDSFSRSVDRAAKAHATPLQAVHGPLAIIGGQYAWTEEYAAHDPRKWCISTVTFQVVK